MSTSLGLDPYAALHQEIRQVLLQGKERSRQALELEKVRAYWEVGERLQTHLLQHEERAGYGEQVVARLAADLEMSQRVIYEMLEVYRAFPILRTCAKLAWSHYRELMRIPARKEREFYTCQADTAGWSVRELKAQIKANAFASPVSGSEEVPVAQVEPGPPLVPRKGRLYTYRLVETPRSQDLRLDLGCRIRRAMDLAGLGGAGPGAVVESIQDPAPAPGGQGYRLAVPGDRQGWLYTFKAQVKEVVDGDTLWVVIDCGFDVWVEQKLRLRDVDAPELDTAAGRRARAFVEGALGEVEFVVLGTHRSDKYDRYLSDVFYRPGDLDPQRVLADGLYLNQQLLDEGLARRWVE